MSFATLIHRLIKALVLWAVLGGGIVLLLHFVAVLLGCTCAIEWILLAALFFLNLIAAAVGPALWNQERLSRNK